MSIIYLSYEYVLGFCINSVTRVLYEYMINYFKLVICKSLASHLIKDYVSCQVLFQINAMNYYNLYCTIVDYDSNHKTIIHLKVFQCLDFFVNSEFF